MANSYDIAQSDLAELLNVLGMGDHARPQSPHEVFQEALRVLRARLGKPSPNSTRTGATETEGCPIGYPPGECEWPVCGCARIVTAATRQPWPAGDDVAARLLIDAVGCEDLAPRASIERRFREAFAEAAISYRQGAKCIRELEAALAARPEAPSDAGWSREDLEAFVAREWPEGRSAGAAARELVRALGVRGLAPTLQRLLTDLLGQINFASTDRAQILADFANAAPEAARMAKIDSFERWNPRVFDPTPPSDPAPSGQAEG